MIIACFRKQVESCKQDLPVITNSTQITPLLAGSQKNIGDLLENIDKAVDKYDATYSIGSKSKSSVSRKKKENRKKSEDRK